MLRPLALRRNDGWRCRGDDGFPGLLLRQGSRSAALHGAGSEPVDVSQDPLQSQPAMALQYVSALPRIPHGEAQPALHGVGHAYLQHFRLAEALLSDSGRVCRYVPATAGLYRLVEIRL